MAFNNGICRFSSEAAYKGDDPVISIARRGDYFLYPPCDRYFSLSSPGTSPFYPTKQMGLEMVLLSFLITRDSPDSS